MSETFPEGHLNTKEIQTWAPQVDNFSKELSDFLSDDKFTNKEQISNVLKSNSDLKNGFEEFLKTANNRLKLKCKKELQNCSTEEEIKTIILENIPGWYKVWDTDKSEISEMTDDVIWEAEEFLNIKKQADQKTEQADQKTEQADRRIDKSEDFKNMDEALQLRQNLLKDNPLDRETQEQAAEIKNQIPENVKNQLQGYNDEYIYNYILVNVTLKAVKDNPDFDQGQVVQFEEKVKSLSNLDILLKSIDNRCNTADTNFDSFNKKNFSQTRTELFDEHVWNKSLRDVKELNMASHGEKYEEMFPKMWFEDALVKYGKFLQWDLKEFYNQYQNNPEIRDKINWMRNNPNSTDEDIKLYNKYNEMYWALMWKEWQPWIKDVMENKTKDLMEELCIISQIKWMYMCMWEDLWDDFNLNKANEIKAEKINDENFLTLNGHIDWIDFAIRQNTTKEEPLQTSTKLVKEWGPTNHVDKTNDFIFWWDGSFVNSNFILPTQNQIFNLIKETIQSDKSLENYDNQEEYLENLQTNIMSNINKKYENTKFAHHYMQEQVKWEKIINKTISFVEKIKGSQPDSRISNSNPQLYDFINLIDFNVKNSTSAEKNRLNNIMEKLNNMVYLATEKPTDWELENHMDKFAKYLTGQSLLNTRSILNGNPIDWGNTQYAFDLFKNYENQWDERNDGELHMINFDQMLIDLNKVEEKQAEIEAGKENKKDLVRLEMEIDEAYSEISYA